MRHKLNTLVDADGDGKIDIMVRHKLNTLVDADGDGKIDIKGEA